MAAITPHLGQYESTPLEIQHDTCGAARLGGELGLGDETACPTPLAVVRTEHGALLSMAYVRQAVEELLIGKSIRLQRGDIDGKRMRSVFLVLTDAAGTPVMVGKDPLWNPAGTGEARQYGLLSWTSKMGCPSFSLPAGATQVGGSCPGAAGGQSIVPEAALAAGSRLVLKVTGQPARLEDAICERCYAEGGQYSTGQVQFAQVMRYHWAKAALGSGAFVETMVAAIDSANFYLEGGRMKADGEDDDTAYAAERLGRRFFRIHDSGDFFDRAYLKAWADVARALPDITFWAPTRIWAASWGLKAVKELPIPPNLVLRPSAYHVNERPPDLAKDSSHWAQGSAAISAGVDRGMTADRERMVTEAETKERSKIVAGIRAELADVEAKMRESKAARLRQRHDELSKALRFALTPRAPGGPDDRYSWSCRAYAAASQKVTCRDAVGPDGKIGCRACWITPSEIIAYTEH